MSTYISQESQQVLVTEERSFTDRSVQTANLALVVVDKAVLKDDALVNVEYQLALIAAGPVDYTARVANNAELTLVQTESSNVSGVLTCSETTLIQTEQPFKYLANLQLAELSLIYDDSNIQAYVTQLGASTLVQLELPTPNPNRTKTLYQLDALSTQYITPVDIQSTSVVPMIRASTVAQTSYPEYVQSASSNFTTTQYIAVGTTLTLPSGLQSKSLAVSNNLMVGMINNKFHSPFTLQSSSNTASQQAVVAVTTMLTNPELIQSTANVPVISTQTVTSYTRFISPELIKSTLIIPELVQQSCVSTTFPQMVESSSYTRTVLKQVARFAVAYSTSIQSATMTSSIITSVATKSLSDGYRDPATMLNERHGYQIQLYTATSSGFANPSNYHSSTYNHAVTVDIGVSSVFADPRIVDAKQRLCHNVQLLSMLSATYSDPQFIRPNRRSAYNTNLAT